MTVSTSSKFPNYRFGAMPDLVMLRHLVKLTWAAASASIECMLASTDDIHRAMLVATGVGASFSVHSGTTWLSFKGARDLTTADVLLVKEALELLTLSLVMLPGSFEQLQRDKSFQQFIVDLLLVSNNLY